MSLESTKKVLICDDDEITRMTLSKKVSKVGYEVVGEAIDGLEAMNKFGELKPDIVLLDINMPKASGLTVLSFIRENNKLCRVVMITGNETNHTSEFVIKALKAGANDYLTKGNFDDNRFKKAIGHKDVESDFNENDAHSLIKDLEVSQKEVSDAIKEKQKQMEEESKDSVEEQKPKENEKTIIRRMARSSRFK